MNLITIQYAQMQNQKYAILFRSFHSAAASNIALNSLKGFNTPKWKVNLWLQGCIVVYAYKTFFHQNTQSTLQS